MSVKYSGAFLVLAVAAAMLASAAWGPLGWFAVIPAYVAISFLLLALAYAGAGPGLLLKQPSGRHAPWAWVLFGPYFLLNAVTFGLYRRFSREPATVEVAPGVFLGRRLARAECSTPMWRSVLDLAAEFAEARPLRALAGYRSLPVLDATPPSEEQLRSAAAWVAEAVRSGPVYIHCALGHGRSACVVIAYLLLSGQVKRAEEGERWLQSLRPGVRLNASQHARLVAFQLQTPGEPEPDHERPDRAGPTSDGTANAPGR